MFARRASGKRMQRWMLEGILRHARREARRLYHEYVDCGHILLGICASADDVVSDYGMSLDAARVAMESEVHLGPDRVRTWQRLAMSPRAEEVVKLALEQSHRSRYGVVLPEHVLDALLSVDDGVTSSVMNRLGLDVAAIRVKLKRAVDSIEIDVSRLDLRYAPWVHVAILESVSTVVIAVFVGILSRSWAVFLAALCGMIAQSVLRLFVCWRQLY